MFAVLHPFSRVGSLNLPPPSSIPIPAPRTASGLRRLGGASLRGRDLTEGAWRRHCAGAGRCGRRHAVRKAPARRRAAAGAAAAVRKRRRRRRQPGPVEGRGRVGGRRRGMAEGGELFVSARPAPPWHAALFLGPPPVPLPWVTSPPPPFLGASCSGAASPGAGSPRSGRYRRRRCPGGAGGVHFPAFVLGCCPCPASGVFTLKPNGVPLCQPHWCCSVPASPALAGVTSRWPQPWSRQASVGSYPTLSQ